MQQDPPPLRPRRDSHLDVRIMNDKDREVEIGPVLDVADKDTLQE